MKRQTIFRSSFAGVLIIVCAIAHLSDAPPAAASLTSDLARQRFVGTSIDLKSTGSTVIIPAQPRKWITKSCTIHVRTSTGLVVVASASLGNNSTSFNNVMAIVVVGTSGSVADSLIDLSTSLIGSAIDLTSTGLTWKVTTGATATTLLADVHVEGFFSEP